MRDRKHFLVAIHAAIGGSPQSVDEQVAVVEALLLTATTIANAMSTTTEDIVLPAIESTAEEMFQHLNTAFELNL